MEQPTTVDADPVQHIVTMPFAPYYDSDGVDDLQRRLPKGVTVAGSRGFIVDRSAVRD